MSLKLLQCETHSCTVTLVCCFFSFSLGAAQNLTWRFHVTGNFNEHRLRANTNNSSGHCQNHSLHHNHARHFLQLPTQPYLHNYEERERSPIGDAFLRVQL